MPESEADQLRTELETLRTAAGNQALKPIVEAFQTALNAGFINIARAGPRVIKGLRQTFGVEGTSRSALQTAAIGILNEGPQEAETIFNVGGDANFKQAVFNITVQAIKQMPAAEQTFDASFVLLAMTKEQAGQLASEQAFQQQPDILQQNFASLQAYLAQIGNQTWVENYGTSPELWRPRGESTIAKLVENALGELNDTGQFKKFVPKFHDIMSLGDGTRASRNLVRQLRGSGCLVIVDAISLRHPFLLRAYQSSLLDVFPSTSVLTLTPGDKALGLIETMVHALQLNLRDSEFHLRVHDNVEGYACHVDSQVERIPKWLVDQVKRIYATAAARPRSIA